MLAASTAGDYSANGFVDASDYVTWRASLNKTVTPGSGADGSGNGVVGAEDYQVWRANFGRLAGDFNTNGAVDAADYVAWRNSLTALPASGAAAATGSLATGADQYALWRANFGHQGSSPPPVVTNWFDSSVHDAALRDLGHNLYLDNLIDRSDMLALFTSAQDGGVVDTTEFGDLQAIVNNAKLFGTQDYIKQLAADVVLGNAANAHYQGQTLGNLVAGAGASQLQSLVNKWFLGLDRPTTTFAYARASGVLFVDGASYSDINQGNVPDCYIMSALAETALKSPTTITNMFIVNGDGTYTVRFYNSGQPEYVTIDSFLPINDAGQLVYAGVGKAYNNPANELWVSLAEKAYAQLNEVGWSRAYLVGSGQNAYAAIDGGYFYAAVGQVTGRTTVAFITTLVETNFNEFMNAYNLGALIGFTSKRTPVTAGVVSNHAYAVFSYNTADQTITLFNPWGIQYGMLTMNWADIQANFTHFDRTTS